MRDDNGGCLGVIVEFILNILGYSTRGGDALGWLGHWAVWLVTFGRVVLDPERWSTILIGFVVLVALVSAIGICKLGD